MSKNKRVDDVLVIQKYKGSKIGILSMLIAVIVSIFCYVTVLFLLQDDSIVTKCGTVLYVIRDSLLMVTSIIATSLLTSVFIEKNRKNIDYTELIANDIFASPEFYTNLTEENKEKVHKYLEENLFLKNPIKNQVYQSCRKKVYSNQLNYYYQELYINISYYDRETYSEKYIKRVEKIRSYNEEITVSKMYLFSYSLSPTEGVENFSIISAGIGEDNEPLEIGKDIIIEKKNERNLLLDKCGYTEVYDVYLSKEVTVLPDCDTILNIEYVSRVTDEDMSARFSVPVPTKKYNFNFTAPQDHIVYAHAFSFLNTSRNFPNSLYRNTIAVNFDNWLLPGEGVAICVAKAKEEQKNESNYELASICS